MGIACHILDSRSVGRDSVMIMSRDRFGKGLECTRGFFRGQLVD